MKSVIKNSGLAPMFHHHDEHCGCGHVHHDHHKEGVHCDCGHDHEQHYEHHEDCDCGCSHEHQEHRVHQDDDDSGGDSDDEEHHNHHHEHCSCNNPHHSHRHHHEHCNCNHEHRDHTHDPWDDQLQHEKTFETGSLSAKEKKIYLLENLSCAHCAAKMEEQIGKLNGVKAVTITYTTGQLRVAADHCDDLLPQIRRICSSIESQVRVIDPAAQKKETERTETSGPLKQKKISKDKLELIYIIAGAVLFAAAAVLHHTGSGTSAVIVLSALSYVILGGKVIAEALRNISKGQIFDENFLMGIATIGAFIISEYLEAVGVMLFYRIGEYFEEKAVEKSRNQIMNAIDMRPETVNLISGDTTEMVAAEKAAVGDILLIRPGDRIPLDGIITEGESRIDTSPITGEPVPVSVSPGDEIISGCVNTSGQLKMRVEKTLSESMVSRILDSVENAAANKPKMERFITRFSRIYTPCVVGAALLLAVGPSLVTGDWNYWIYTALTFLVMSCPCALVLSVPLAFFSGIGAGSRKGILFKGGLSIEALGRLKAVVMDKTGTITEGNFCLQKIVPAEGFTEETLLSLAAGSEQNSTHPIAASILSAARKKKLDVPTPSSLEEIAGCGISAQMRENRILCGNKRLMDRFGISVPPLAEDNYGAEVYIAVDDRFAGYMIISDTLKADAISAINRLKAMGLHTVMLTGDAEESADAVAAQTGIDEVYAKLLPQDKLTMLSKVRQERGSVMFVGDGINDAPVLAGADVGAAMGSGADAAIEAADAVFMNTAAESIPDAVSIAKNTGRIAKQNVIFALTVKALVMILGIIGFANMWLAVFADSGVAMLCVLNSVRILYKRN